MTLNKTTVDSFHSGSTLTGAIIKGSCIIPFNVGDSRWILIKFKSEEAKQEYDLQVNSTIITKDQNEEQKVKFDNKRLSMISSKSVIGAKLDKEAQNDEAISKFEAEQLTFDHSWDVDREQRRILEYGGRVDKVKLSWGVGGIGPLRVWFRHEEKPGLAMTWFQGQV